MKGFSMEYVFRNCISSQFGKVGLECPAASTRSKTVKSKPYRKEDCYSFAFESDENKIIQPPVNDFSALMTLAKVAAEAAEEDDSDMPALITMEHVKALETLKFKEAALKKELKELEALESKLAAVRVLKETVNARREVLIVAINAID
jgi:hypothetical protein